MAGVVEQPLKNQPEGSKAMVAINKMIVPLIVSFLVCMTALESYVSTAKADELLQKIQFTSSPNPVGSGARALGMGGAFIAVCDDATAASWNPAGSIQLERPEMSVVYRFSKNENNNDYKDFPGASGAEKSTKQSLNYLSLAHPVALLGRDITISVNYQHLYDFNNEASRLSERENDSALYKKETKYTLEGELWALSPALAIQITPSLSVGTTLNLWKDLLYKNSWKTCYDENIEITFKATGETFQASSYYTEEYNFSGVNFHLGLLWDINRYITLGVVFKSPFTADLRHNYTFVDKSGSGSDSDASWSVSDNESIDMPMSFGMGIAVRPSDAFTVDLDIYTTRWEDYILHTSTGKSVSPISGLEEDRSKVGNTTQVRLGSEYLIIGEKIVAPIRCGVFYDPEPSKDGVDDFWGFSIGAGVAYKRFVFDTAFQYRFGKDIETNIAGENAVQDKNAYTIHSSLIYYF